MTFAIILGAAAHAGSIEAAWDRMDPYRNLARITEVTEPHHWFEVDGCTVGIPVADPDGPMRERCPDTIVGGRHRLRRRGPRHRDWIGTWREVTVHEDLMLPDRTRDGTHMGSFATVIYAWTDAGLRVEHLDYGGHAVLLPRADFYDLSNAVWLDWRAPPGIEGTSVLYDEAALATLTTATLAALERLDAGETLPTGPDAMPDFPNGQLPETRFGLEWKLAVYPRGGPEPWNEPNRSWVVELPMDQIDGVTRVHRHNAALGLTVDAELDLPAQEVRVRVTGANGDEQTRTVPMRMILWIDGDNIALRDVPRLGEAADELFTVSAPTGSPWTEVEVGIRTLRAAQEPFRP